MGHHNNLRKKKIIFEFNYIFLFLGLIGVFHGIYTILLMFHNIDLSYNTLIMFNDLNNLGHKLNTTTTFDYRLMGDSVSLTKDVNLHDSYITDWGFMRLSIIESIIGTLVFATALTWIYHDHKSYIK